MGGKEQETKVTGTGGQITDITERGQINTYCICINRVMVNPRITWAHEPLKSHVG